MDAGTAAITIGTSGAVRVARKSPLRNYASMSFNYILDEKTFICGGPVNNGGSVVQWLLQGFLGISSPDKEAYALLFEKIQSVPAGSNGLLFLPYINGERAPLWDEHSSGLFFGIRPFHNQECFLRSALEGVCYALRHILVSLEESGSPVRQIHASGGGVHSSMWMHLLADITGKPVYIQQTEDASAIGAAYLVLQNLDSSFSLPAVHRNGWIRPDHKNLLVYEKGFELFKDLYPLLKDSMRLLDNMRLT
jgi:gluconokinase